MVRRSSTSTGSAPATRWSTSGTLAADLRVRGHHRLAEHVVNAYLDAAPGLPSRRPRRWRRLRSRRARAARLPHPATRVARNRAGRPRRGSCSARRRAGAGRPMTLAERRRSRLQCEALYPSQQERWPGRWIDEHGMTSPWVPRSGHGRRGDRRSRRTTRTYRDLRPGSAAVCWSAIDRAGGQSSVSPVRRRATSRSSARDGWPNSSPAFGPSMQRGSTPAAAAHFRALLPSWTTTNPAAGSSWRRWQGHPSRHWSPRPRTGSTARLLRHSWRCSPRTRPWVACRSTPTGRPGGGPSSSHRWRLPSPR